ncbi:MAG: hypothetical protein A2942_00320 [Candidatus Lloydbacteria bacterium RIFCSPLOWO2_01_FULL_50_20]|uniref:Short-chain dehydrogenase n=1 Tax=Candidatus Lloydbacteria bacterium RIFCSPLOWO2_01_FULL_50_20 TaxID=1798665 RepID=A0A1G2DG84_9BACT|nr:MAG: hypothetical protein A3C13_04210 [Candidatus Lloydbacteria bacterium RIFCSPHIGHO2_02_FULL_50_11]OGZ12543.1 MAG: hypothetical protein A2942_00320 [Candidatus Lloydbacteria bacterium RIFCSPLOWO2_01_FULL_50_20]
MKGLNGKRVIVTGGANGIGKAIVERFLAEGAIVFAIDKDATGLKKLSHGNHADRFSMMRVNIAAPDVSAQLKRAKFLSNVDILVNNAGVDLPYDHLTNRGNWEKIFAVNIAGTRTVTEAVLDSMQSRGRGGSIIFITSVHTAFAFNGGGAYDASKHALVGYMRSLALAFGPAGIRSNAIAPGAIYPTNITRGIPMKEVVRIGKTIPTPRFGTPHEIAGPVAWLASDDAAYVNGAEIRVDGGLAIKAPFEE